MKNLNAIIILATVAGMATLTACSSAKAEQATDTKEASVPETTTATPTPGPGFGGPGMMGPGMGGFDFSNFGGASMNMDDIFSMFGDIFGGHGFGGQHEQAVRHRDAQPPARVQGGDIDFSIHDALLESGAVHVDDFDGQGDQLACDA